MGAALLSKESGMVLPILVIVFTWIYGGAGGREVVPGESNAGSFTRLGAALGASIPFWMVLLAYVPLRIWALKGFAHVITPISLSRELFTIPSVLLFYLRLLVWPSGLSCYYDTPYVSSPGWHDFILPALLLAVAAAALTYWYGRTRRSAPEEAKALAFGCVWMVLTVLPVLNFRFFPEGELAHDRYVYLPSVGFVILVATALRQAMRGAGEPVNRPAWSLLGALVLSIVLGWATASQSLYWADDLTLNFRAHQIAPSNVSATTSLAAAVAQRGMDGTAMALYQQALAIQPNFWRANVNLAYLYYAHENYPEAARHFARACAADPTDGDQFLYLGMALLRMGKFSEAEESVRSALLVRPQGKDYHLGMGMVLKAEGKLPEAKQEIAVELAEDPQNAQARTLLDEVSGEMQAQAEKPATWKPTKRDISKIK
jgi:tetratricopeptide (TPR) repeat protein